MIPTKPIVTNNDIGCIHHDEEKYSSEITMINHGYLPMKQIAKTLQGSIWRVSKKSMHNQSNQSFIIKITDKSLHNNCIAMIKGKKYKINEDVVKEATILKYLTMNEPPQSLVQYIDFFNDKNNFFLVQQDGGNGLFEFVRKSHKLINKGLLSIQEWQKVCKIIMKQMVNTIDWLHNKMHCVHFDVSLENFVIDNVMVEISSDNYMTFLPGIQIKLIDFGLAELFSNQQSGFLCNKYVGKTRYQAPENYAKKALFDAATAECWSLGVVCFTMIVGVPPLLRPCKDDPFFECIMDGHLSELLVKYNKLFYLSPPMFDLILNIFKSAKNRIKINEMKKHAWLV